MQIDFYFDFGSPNAYLTNKVLPQILDRTGATVRYIPILLGGVFKATGNQPPWQAFADVPSKVGYEELEFKRFVVKHQLFDFKMNPNFPINTLALMRGAAGFELQGQEALNNYINDMLVGMWEEGVNFNDMEAAGAALAKAGYSPEEFLAMIGSDEVKEKLKQNTTDAVARGVFGIPTIFVGDEMFFGKERLGQIEEEIVKQMGAK